MREIDFDAPRREPHRVECDRCGRDGLHWQDVDGEWVLMESVYRVHHCESKRVLDAFPVLK